MAGHSVPSPRAREGPGGRGTEPGAGAQVSVTVLTEASAAQRPWIPAVFNQMTGFWGLGPADLRKRPRPARGEVGQG